MGTASLAASVMGAAGQAPRWTGRDPCDGDVLLPLSRRGQVEALKEMQLALTADVCSLQQECGPAQVQLRDMILQLEALEPGHSEDSHRVLQLAQEKMPVLERTVRSPGWCPA